MPATHRVVERASTALVAVVLALVPAAFWASIAWLLWGGLAGAIVAIVVLAVTVLTMGLLRSAGDWESPAAVSGDSEFRQAA